MLPDGILPLLCLLVPVAPAAVTLALVAGFVGAGEPGERAAGRAMLAGVSLSAAASVALLVAWSTGPESSLVLEAGRWFGTDDRAFEVVFGIDRLSAPILVLVESVILVVTRFAVPYMHREAGFARFFTQLGLFASGMPLVVMAGSADLLLVGWECVGLSSALLVAFFQERTGPPRAATRVFTTYRLADVGLLVGVMMMHVLLGGSDFHRAFAVDGWPGGTASVDPAAATAIAAAFAVAAIGKSAQLPVGGWLPRAMEGPTPSSALFYGGPAVHAGVYLLMRLAPLLAAAPAVSLALVGIGLATALHSSILARVQNDQKCALAYATMTQLGLMVAECGLGLWGVAWAHWMAHVCLRTYQLLRAPSVLHDTHTMRATNHGDPLRFSEPLASRLPAVLRRRAYLLGLERTHVDTVIERWVLQPVLRVAAACDRAERDAADAVARAVERAAGSRRQAPAPGHQATSPREHGR